jgi:hypothetical protein
MYSKIHQDTSVRGNPFFSVVPLSACFGLERHTNCSVTVWQGRGYKPSDCSNDSLEKKPSGAEFEDKYRTNQASIDDYSARNDLYPRLFRCLATVHF